MPAFGPPIGATRACRAQVVRRHTDDFNGFILFERRDDLRTEALRLEWETDFGFHIVALAQSLLVWSSIDSGYVVDSLLPDGISLCRVGRAALRAGQATRLVGAAADRSR